MQMAWATSDTISSLALLVSGASALYAYRTLKATIDLKRNDLRLLLETANETLRLTVLSLPKAIDDANRSRRSVFVAHNSLGGSESRKWDERVQGWRDEVKAIEQRLPSGFGLDQMNLDELRAALVETHGYQSRASAVRDELGECRRQDDLAFVEFRADQRAMRDGRLGVQQGR